MGEASEKRKPVIFNVEDPRDKFLYDLAENLPNWSGWSKDCLEAAARRQGLAVPEKRKGRGAATRAQHGTTPHSTVPSAGQTKNPPSTGGQG